jgi:hypothetical protein
MTSPTKKPKYNLDELHYDELAETHLGKLFNENIGGTAGLRNAVRVLSEYDARAMWNLTFGDADNKAAIARNNWTSTIQWAAIGDWLAYYNIGDSQPVEKQLRSLVHWRNDQLVLFIKGPCDVVVTNWQSFVKNWLTFFEYDDDGPFIIPVDCSDVLRVCPNGTFLKGTFAETDA